MKNKSLSYSVLLLVIMCYALSACVSTSSTLSRSGIEKRRYTKGYFIDLRDKQLVYQKRMPLKTIMERATPIIDQATLASPPSVGPLGAVRPMVVVVQGEAIDCGDEITFRTGEQLRAKVISVGIREITYKKCDNIDGPNYVVDKSEIFMIEYSNGDKDVFDSHADDEYYVQGGYEEPSTSIVKIERYSIVSLVMGITSFFMPIGFILGILGIVFGRKALRRIADGEGTLKGQGMARAGIILGIVNIAVTILIVALVIAVFI